MLPYLLNICIQNRTLDDLANISQSENVHKLLLETIYIYYAILRKLIYNLSKCQSII